MHTIYKQIQYLYVIVLTFLGYYLLGKYEYGDQVYYRDLYNELQAADFLDSFYLAFKIVGSSEPLSIILLWIGAKLSISKDLYISVFNFILLLGIILFCRKCKSGGLTLFLMTINFYIWVLLTSAERLKFAFIIITYAFLYYENLIIRKSLLIISITAHFQSILFMLGLIPYKEKVEKNNVGRKKKWIILIPLIILLIYILDGYFYENLIRKFDVYSGSGDIYALFNPLVIFIVSWFSLKSRIVAFRVFLVFMPLFYVFGSDRLTMVYFLLLFYLLGIERNLNNTFFIAALIYFAIKNISYISNILIFGTGFV